MCKEKRMSAKERRKFNNKLTPSKTKIEKLELYANEIVKSINLIKASSGLAHKGIATFEVVQEVIDLQMVDLRENVEWLHHHLGDE